MCKDTGITRNEQNDIPPPYKFSYKIFMIMEYECERNRGNLVKIRLHILYLIKK